MKKISLFFAFVFLLASCKFQRILKNDDWRFRYKAALDYYNKSDYGHAGILLEELIPIIKGSPEGEKAQFYFAYCNYQQGQYLMSSHYFKTFFDTYNRSEFAEEAFYMYAYSQYADSPPVYLDQTSTSTAIDAFQEFLNRFPTSKYAVQANNLIKELRIKLETKAFNTAKLYHKLQRYQAAVIAFENFQKDFPDSYMQEEAAYLRVSTQFEMAEKSYEYKKKARYETTIKYYQSFIDRYPESKYLKQAEEMFAKSQEQVRKREEAEKEAEKNKSMSSVQN
jgi:outer membrane protein assembly factor BamD